MPKKPLTPLESDLRQLKISLNKAHSEFSFSNARTVGTMLNSMGLDDAAIRNRFGDTIVLSHPVTYKEIDEVWGKKFEEEIRAKYNALAVVPTVSSSVDDAIIDDGDYDPTDLSDTSVYHAKPPKQKATLHKKQIIAAKRLTHNIIDHGYRGQTLLAGTGTGKTYVFGSLIRNLIDNNFLKSRTISPWPIVVVTKASVVIQTRRVLKYEFGLDPALEFHVVNIEQLRSEFGSMFLKEDVIVEQGEPHIKFTWKKYVHPCIFVWDECQIVKNEGSQQSKIAQDANEIEYRYNSPVFQIFSSATPFTKVCEARCIAVSTRLKHDFGIAKSIPLVDSHWHQFAKEVAYPADAIENSPAAVERLIKHLDPYIVQMRNVKGKHHARNSVRKIDFRTLEERAEYKRAWQDYLIKKAKIEGLHALSGSESRMLILVHFLKFRQKAELIRAPYLAEAIVRFWDSGRTVGVAVCFKETLNSIVRCLTSPPHNWTRDMISIIWGGNVKQKIDEKKMKASKLYSNEELKTALKDVGIELSDFGIFESDVPLIRTPEEEAWIKRMRLGPQNPAQRQEEIDAYQIQKTRCCLFTFKSGGVGLSLHHAYPNARPRVGILTPVYSAIELVQGLGRLPRLTSLSDTEQEIVFYRGTIEEHVADRVALKLKCLSKVVRQRESWDEIITGDKWKEEQRTLIDDVDEELEDTYIEDEGDNTN